MYETSGKPIRVDWEGAWFVHHSLALVNRELARGLTSRGVRIRALRSEPDAEPLAGEARDEALAAALAGDDSGPAHVTIRHRWPPRFDPPASGPLVLIQPWEFGRIPRDWVRPLMERVDELWVPSRYARDCYVLSGIPGDRVAVVPNGVDARRFRPGLRPLELPTRKRRRLLFVGGALPRKGLKELLEAYLSAFRPEDDVCLVVKDAGVGGVYRDAPLRDLVRSLAGRPDLPEILHLESTLSEADMPRLYAACDLFVHPYLGEGFGLPIAEAMACEMPVVVTGSGAALDFCDDECAYLVPAVELPTEQHKVGPWETVGRPRLARPDVEALARILRAALERPEEARRRARAARLKALRDLSWDRAAAIAGARLVSLVGTAPRRRTESSSAAGVVLVS